MKNFLNKNKINLLVLISYFFISLFVFWKLFFLPSGEKLHLTSDFVQYWNILYYAATHKISELFFDPYQYFGSSLIGRVDLGIFYPPMMIVLFITRLFNLDAFRFYGLLELSSVLHLGFGAYFCYLLAKQYVRDYLSSFLSGLAFSLSGVFLVSINAFPLTNAAIWIPLQSYFLIKYIRNKNNFDLVLSSLFLSFTYLAGIPQITLYSFIFSALLCFWEIGNINIDLIKIYSSIKILISLSLITICFLIIPLAFHIPASAGSNRNSMSYTNTAIQGNISPIYLTDYFLPHFFDSENNIVKSYFSQNYLGLLTVISLLLFPVLIKSKKKYFFFFAFFFFLILGMGGETLLHDFFYNFIPGVKLFRNISKLNFIVSLSAAIILASFVENIKNQSQKAGMRITRLLFQVMVFSLFVYGVILATPLLNFRTSLSVNPPVVQDISLYKQQSEDISVQILFFIVTASILIFIIRSKKKKTLLMLLVFFFVLDITRFNIRVPQNSSKLDPEKAYSNNAYIKFIKNDTDSFRVSYQFPIPANYAPDIVGIENLGGYSSLIPESASNYLQLLSRYSGSKAYSKLAGLANQKYVVADETYNVTGYKKVFSHQVDNDEVNQYYCPGEVSWVPCAPGKIFTIFENQDYFKKLEILKNPQILEVDDKTKQLSILEEKAVSDTDFHKFIIISASEVPSKIAPKFKKPIYSQRLNVSNGDVILIAYPYDQNLILTIDNNPVSYRRANYGFIAYLVVKDFGKKDIIVSIYSK